MQEWLLFFITKPAKEKQLSNRYLSDCFYKARKRGNKYWHSHRQGTIMIIKQCISPTWVTKNLLAIVATCFALTASPPLWAQEVVPLTAEQSKIITKQYDDGSIYQGTFRDGKPHGIGSFRLTNGYEYVGDWVDGVITGMGEARYANGAVYTGMFLDGKPNGNGLISYADGSSYEGAWIMGAMTGKGDRKSVV